MDEKAKVKRNVLNLDELFGSARAIKVKFAGRDYELRRPESLGPKEYLKWQKLYKRVMALFDENGGNEDQQAEEMEEIYDQILGLIGPELVKVDGLLFVMKMRALQFYLGELQAEKKAG